MKILLTATVQSHIAQFHKPLINMLKNAGHTVHVAARNDLSNKDTLHLEEADKIFDVPFARSPISMKNIKAYKMIKDILRENQYDIVHTNTPMGSVITRLAAKKFRKKGLKVFYTAHGFHFYRGAPIKNWLIYYPIEKHLSRYTDKLITINEEDYNTATNKNFKSEVIRIHGVGADSEKFYLDTNVKNSNYHERLNLICIGELNKNKNQMTVLKAIKELKMDYSHIHVYFAGDGPLKDKLKKYVDKNRLNEHVTFLGYRRDLDIIMSDMDILISASKREGLPLNIIEAHLTGLPVIASNNRGHNELVKEKVNGYLFEIGDFNSIVKIIKNIISYEYTLRLDRVGIRQRAIKFSQKEVLKELKNIYNLII